jgi:adenosine/AMP kinase
MSMMSKAVLGQSRAIGSGSAMTVALETCREFAITIAPRARELFGFSEASAMPLCTMRASDTASENLAYFQVVAITNEACSFAVRTWRDGHLLIW